MDCRPMPETFLHGVELLEVDTGARPIRTVRSSVIGIVGSSNVTLESAKLTLGTGTSQIIFESSAEGAIGNSIAIELVKLAGLAPLAISVAIVGVTRKVTIQLQTNSSGVVLTTALDLEAGLGIGSPSYGLIIARRPINNVGTGIMAVASQTSLTGGAGIPFPFNTPTLFTSTRNVESYFGTDSYLTRTIRAIYKQTGALMVVVRASNLPDDSVNLTGVYALKKAQSVVGYVPRIILRENATVGFSNSKSVAASLRAMLVYTPEAGTTASQATAYQAANGNDRTVMLWPMVNGGEDPSPYMAGVMARSDNERGFWWSPSNREVFGIESLDSPVDFQMADTSSLANILNEGKVTTFIREGGFRIWGNLTGSIDPKYQFISVRRTADIINDSILTNHLWAVDRNITTTYLQDVSGGVSDYLQTLVNLGAVIGGTCWPDPDLNSPDQIALGKVYFNFDFTPPYPAQTVTFRSILTNDYLTELI